MQQQYKKITQDQWKALGGFDNPNLFRKSLGRFGFKYYQYI